MTSNYGKFFVYSYIYSHSGLISILPFIVEGNWNMNKNLSFISYRETKLTLNIMHNIHLFKMHLKRQAIDVTYCVRIKYELTKFILIFLNWRLVNCCILLIFRNSGDYFLRIRYVYLQDELLIKHLLSVYNSSIDPFT